MDAEFGLDELRQMKLELRRLKVRATGPMVGLISSMQRMVDKLIKRFEKAKV